MMSIKKILKSISALCVICACFSCQSDEFSDEFQDESQSGFSDESKNEFLKYIDMKEPDMVIKNTSGTLFFHKELKMWYVSRPFPGTNDSHDNYLIAEKPNKNFLFEEGKQVSVSGFCYYIPRLILMDIDYFYPAGTEYYYIKVTDLK